MMHFDHNVAFLHGCIESTCLGWWDWRNASCAAVILLCSNAIETSDRMYCAQATPEGMTVGASVTLSSFMTAMHKQVKILPDYK